MVNSTPVLILHVAVAKPVRHCFDYLLPLGSELSVIKPGVRILVPFGKKQQVGILIKADYSPCIAVTKLKPATAFIDTEPLIPEHLLTLYQWASRYYQHPIGEVILGTLPTLLRREKAYLSENPLIYQAVDFEHPALATLKRSPRQADLLTLLQSHAAGLSLTTILASGFTSPLLKTLEKKGLIKSLRQPLTNSVIQTPAAVTGQNPQQAPYILNPAQINAITQINAAAGFQTYLLQGVTGSGKTEVYLQVIAHYLRQGQQALVLVPEIGLTPQTIARFEQRFPLATTTLHSKLSDRERLDAWLKAKNGAAQIIIGTRSALFTPLPNLGIIVLDEEHDHSFKQQNGFRYSARDLAVLRGYLQGIPVVLGTATPSLETLHNTHIGRFQCLSLPERAGTAIAPTFHLIDLRMQYLEEGLSPALLAAIRRHLLQESQVLLFLNRRGFAPALLCHSCGWSAHCQSCDAGLTVHQQPRRLICHHCARTYPIVAQCPQCHQPQLVASGYGTERLEQALLRQFPETPVVRIDRDSIRHKGAMEKMLASTRLGQSQILLGTQMLAKGHHFPDVTMVGIINADGGLYSTDFRGSEQMGQLIVQVAGRAGRAQKPGEVYIQTHNPDHPLLHSLIHQGYGVFAENLLQDRRLASWPPFSALALLRAEAMDEAAPLEFLNMARLLAEQLITQTIQISGPIAAPMARKAGYFRALLLFQAAQRPVLQRWLELYMAKLAGLKLARQVRWSIDVDPIEMF